MGAKNSSSPVWLYPSTLSSLYSEKKYTGTQLRPTQPINVLWKWYPRKLSHKHIPIKKNLFALGHNFCNVWHHWFPAWMAMHKSGINTTGKLYAFWGLSCPLTRIINHFVCLLTLCAWPTAPDMHIFQWCHWTSSAAFAIYQMENPITSSLLVSGHRGRTGCKHSSLCSLR